MPAPHYPMNGNAGAKVLESQLTPPAVQQAGPDTLKHLRQAP